MKITVTIPNRFDKKIKEAAKNLDSNIGNYITSVVVNSLEKEDKDLSVPNRLNTVFFKDDLKIALSIIDKVAKKSNVTYKVMKSRNKKRSISDIRHLAIYLINEFTYNLNEEDIAKLFLRDRTTIMYSINEMSYKVDEYPEIKKVYDELKTELKTELKIY